MAPMRRWNSVRMILFSAKCSIAMLFVAGVFSFAEPSPSAVAGFDAYIGRVEARLADQHRSAQGFLVGVGSAGTDEKLRRGELIIEQLTPGKVADLPGALLHDWRGTAFVRGATAADFERLMKDFKNYPQRFAPQVTEAQIISPSHVGQTPDHFVASMRVRQKHVITVVMDTTYDITYGRLDARHGYSSSRSTSINEIADAGTPHEHALTPKEDHGFLWRLNTYWSFEERDGGLYIQIESVSLTRAIPTGLGWVIGPYVKSVPRESLEFTLRATCNALRK